MANIEANVGASSLTNSDDLKIGFNPPVRKLSVASVNCRICYDNEKAEDLIAPCHCKVSIKIINEVLVTFRFP